VSSRRQFYISRRQILRGVLASAAFAATAKLGTGCTPTEQTPAESPTPGEGGTSPSASGEELVIGFIYVGSKDDFGWNQAHAEGAAGIAKLPGIKIVEQEQVPETSDVQEVMRNMIEEDGAKVVFPTSFGYFDPHILEVAKDYPEVQFFHAGALWQEGMPDNIGSYFGDVDDAQYVAGVVAAETSKSGKLGFVAAKPINPVLRNLNSFMLGARSAKPDITMQVIFTGNWSLPVKEAEATNSLADQGIDVVGMHVDSPKVVIETAEKRGIFSSGFHVIQSELAPKGYLTGTAWDWTSVYTNYVDQIKEGKSLMKGDIPHLIRGSLKEKFIKMAPYGAAVSDETKKKADEVREKLIDGSLLVYSGEIADNKGDVKIPQGKTLKVDDSSLDKMDYLVEGVIGSTSG